MESANALVSFKFGRAWKHAGKRYARDDSALLSAAVVDKLKKLGADKPDPAEVAAAKIDADSASKTKG